MNSPTKFLSGKRQSLKSFAIRKGHLAIALLGSGRSRNAWELIAIAGPVRIICDAESGGCNPEELTKMLDTENVHVKTKE